MSAIPNVVESGNVVSQGAASAQERYYNFMLMKEKLTAGAGLADNSREKAILTARSEKEEIEQQILAKLVDIKESSPEFAQVSEITGSTDKFEMARELASLVYDKTRAEQILAFYTPKSDDLKKQFFLSQASSAKHRIENLAGGITTFAGKSLGEILTSKILGIGAPA